MRFTGEVRHLHNELAGDVAMTVGRDENGKARRSELCRHELPCRLGVPRPPHHPRMRCDAQKLVKYPPGCVPAIRPRPLALQPVAAGGMKWRVGVGSINQHIGIDYEH